MAKTIPPGLRPPNVQRNPPADRGRAGRAQGGKAQGVKRPEEVHDKEEIDEESMSSNQDDDALREVERQEQRRYGAFRRDNQDFNKQAEADTKAPKPPAESVIPGPNSPVSSAASAPGKALSAPPSPVEAKAPPPAAPTPAASTTRAAAAASIESLLTAELMKKSSRGVYSAPSAPPKTSAPEAPAPAARPKVTMTTRPAAPAASNAVSLPPTRMDARALLTTAQPAGTLLSQASRMASPPALPPQLADAADATRRMLAGVRGVERVTPGVFKGEPVVFIGVEFGLTREALRALPEKVQDFKTVISLPFEALPLRRAPQGK